MSIILDALRRADESREEHSPRSAPARVPKTRRRQRVRWQHIAMVLIALNLAVIVIWLSRTHTVSDVPAPSLDDRPMIRSAPPTGRATDEPPSEMIRAPSDEVVSNDPLVREPDARTPRPPNTTTASARIDAPLLGELPLSFRQTLPQFRLDVHVYADDRARRFVMLNLERLSEGDLSADGLEVVEIQADGVVLYWEGQLFFMPR